MQDIYTTFLTPRNIQVQSISPTRSRITLEPFERGFGYTLGNALRRILLSSMPGAAVVEVQIDNVLHDADQSIFIIFKQITKVYSSNT